MERFELRNKYRKITVDGVQRKKELLVKSIQHNDYVSLSQNK